MKGNFKFYTNSTVLAYAKMNLGGPSLRTCQKCNTAFKTKSGSIKHLSITNLKLIVMKR